MIKKILTKFIVFLCALVSVFCVFGCQNAQNPTAMSGSEVYDAYRSIVVEVIAGAKSGTAFVVDSVDGKVVLATAYHVTGYDDSKVQFRFFGSDTFVGGASVIGYDVKHDVAFFEIDYSQTVKKVDGFSQANAGEKVYAIGNADGEGVSIVDGIISVKEEVVKYGASNFFKPLIRTSARISSGNSGGLLVSESGKVVGMTVASDELNYSKNYALPISLLNALYNRVKQNKRNAQVRFPSFSLISEDVSVGESIKKINTVTLYGKTFTFDGGLYDVSEDKHYTAINGKNFSTITSLVEGIIGIDGEGAVLSGADGELTI